MAEIVIKYKVEGTEDIKQVEEHLEQLNKENKVTQKEVDKTSKKMDQGSESIAGMGEQLQATANNINVMGVGLGDLGLKAGGAIKAIKGMSNAMKVFRAAMISSGVGALIVALGSLVAFLTKTERGADKLSQVMAGLGAAIDVLMDRFISLGESISGLFTDPIGTLKNWGETFVEAVTNPAETWNNLLEEGKGILEEINDETAKALAIEKELQAVRNNELLLNVERSKANALIKEFNKIGEDVTKSLEVRTEMTQKAIDLEEDLIQRELANERRRVEAIRLRNELGESTFEDREELANAEIELNNMIAASEEVLTTLQNKRNILFQQLKDELVGAGPIMIQSKNDEVKFELKTQKKMKKIGEDSTEEKKKQAELQKEIQKELSGSQFNMLSGLAASQSKLGKALALFEIFADTRKAVMKSVAASPLTGGMPWAGIAIGLGAANAAKVLSLKPPKVNAPVFKKGGIINGLSHDQGGELIEAEGGEFVLNKKAVSHYGLPLIEALNNMEVGSGSVNVNQDRVVKAIKEIPVTQLRWDENGFTEYQHRKTSMMQRKAKRYSSI